MQVQCQLGLLVRDLVHRSGGGCRGRLAVYQAFQSWRWKSRLACQPSTLSAPFFLQSSSTEFAHRRRPPLSRLSGISNRHRISGGELC